MPRPARPAPTGGAGGRRQRRRHPAAVRRRHLRPHHRQPRCSSTSPTTAPRSPSWPGCCGRAARSPSPCRRGCPRRSAGRCPTSTTPRSSRAATCASTPRPGCGAQLRGGRARARRRPPRPRAAHAVLVAASARSGPRNDDHPLVQAVPPAAGVGHRRTPPLAVTRLADRLLNPVLGKSLVVYARKPRGRARCSLPDDVPGIVTAPPSCAQHRRRHRRVAAARRHDPVVPRRPRRPVEPRRGGHGPRRSAAAGPRPSGPTTGWSRMQRPDGAWHQYYLADRVEQDKLDANVCAYVAAGVWHHCLLARRPRLRRDDVAGGRAGHRLRARPADAAGRDHLGPPRRRHAVVVRPAHRVVVDLPLAALRHRPRRAPRPRAARLGAVGRAAWPTSSPTSPTPSRRSTAGRWTGTTRCSPACVARRGRPRAAGGPARHVRRWTAGACGA